MAESRRTRILEALMAACGSIHPAHGYASEVPPAHVFYGLVMPEHFPSVVISLGDERPSESRAHDVVDFWMPVELQCWVDEQNGQPGLALEELLADVRTVVQTDATLWNLILELRDNGAMAPVVSDADPTRGQVTLTVEMLYRTQRVNPRT
jgi:hypothetical protein